MGCWEHLIVSFCVLYQRLEMADSGYHVTFTAIHGPLVVMDLAYSVKLKAEYYHNKSIKGKNVL